MFRIFEYIHHKFTGSKLNFDNKLKYVEVNYSNNILRDTITSFPDVLIDIVKSYYGDLWLKNRINYSNHDITHLQYFQNNMVVFACKNNRISILNMDNLIVKEYDSQTIVKTMAISKTGDIIIWSSIDNELRILNTQTGEIYSIADNIFSDVSYIFISNKIDLTIITKNNEIFDYNIIDKKLITGYTKILRYTDPETHPFNLNNLVILNNNIFVLGVNTNYLYMILINKSRFIFNKKIY